MKYMGSKNRHAKELLPIILAGRQPGQWYVEPFVGGANMIDKVGGNRIGADIHADLIAALALIRDHADELPKDSTATSDDEYKVYRAMQNGCPCALRGYHGFALSYGGKWFGGWRRDKTGKRDYVAEAYRGALKQQPGLQGVQLVCATYDHLSIPENSIIYCDPPYEGATGYKDSFDHVAFWQWCRDKAKEGHTVYISEYSAPEDFTCVWQKTVNNTLVQNTGSKQGTERLFCLTPKEL
jgi:DNA adenine methylase